MDREDIGFLWEVRLNQRRIPGSESLHVMRINAPYGWLASDNGLPIVKSLTFKIWLIHLQEVYLARLLCFNIDRGQELTIHSLTLLD